MIDTMIALLPLYGTAVVFWSTLLGCFGVPAPASVSLLAAGAFVATGKMDLAPVLVAGFVGGVIGDLAGYWVGRRGAGWADRLTTQRPGAAEQVARARAVAARWGSFGVFITRWLLSPIGPVVNVLAGMAGMGWRRFALWSVTGKILWIALFVGLGHAFSHSLTEAAGVTGTVTIALVTVIAVIFVVLPFWPFLQARLVAVRR